MSDRSLISNLEFTRVGFYIQGDEDTKRDSSVNVVNSDISRNGMPHPGGIYDPHLGTTDNIWRCQTCQNTKKLCPGHSGHLNLKYPVQNPLFLKEIVKWLKVICFKCGNTVIPIVDLPVPQHRLLGEYVKLSKGKKCRVCGEPHPNIIKDKSDHITVWIEGEDKSLASRKQLYPHQILLIFNRISDETVQSLKKPVLCHPRKFILNMVRIPSNTIRPDIKKIEGGRSNNNDLTIIIQNIVKVNEALPNTIPKEIDPDMNKQIYLLNLLYYELIHGTTTTTKRGIVSTTKKQLMAIAKRWPRKYGRFRRNLMGRRTKNMMRSVITCDISLKIDEVGVPLNRARSIQIPVMAQEHNREELMIYFMNGNKRYPGCSKIKKQSTGKEHWIGNIPADFELEIGDILYRDLITGDVANFNRQPSLEPTSILAHKIVVLPHGETLRMNVIDTPNFNADFDGDSMNLAIPQSAWTMNEIMNLSSSNTFFVSLKNSRPKIGQIQDSLIGTAELTRNSTKIDKLHQMRMFGQIDCFPDFSDAKPAGGNDMITRLFTELGLNINFTRTSNYYEEGNAPFIKYDPKDIDVKINRGKLLHGILDSSSIGEGSAGGIFHLIHNEYGAKAALNAAFDVQQIAISFLFQKGYTVGIKDMILSNDAIAKIHEIESLIMKESYQITEELNQGKIIPPIGKTTQEYYEEKQLNQLSSGDMLVGPVLSNMDIENNGFVKLVLNGSKGKPQNIYSSVSAIGQSRIKGARMKEELGGRTLPYWTKHDANPASRGYISRSYILGIGMAEFIANAQEARVSLIGIAMGTAVSGESNRKSIKNLESMKINNVRQAVKDKNIIQVLYGGDGSDPRYAETVIFPTVGKNLSDAGFEKMYHARAKDFGARFNNKNVQKILDEEYQQLVADRAFYRNTFLNVEQNTGKLFSNKMQMPVNVRQIIENVIYQFGAHGGPDPVIALEKVQKLCNSIPYVLLNSIQERNKSAIPSHIRKATELICILIRSYLNTSEMLRRKISMKLLDIIIDQIRIAYSRSLMSYGTSIGIIAAQSISEPMTQLALDSKHRAGLGGGKVKGMSRIKEIFSRRPTEKMKAPTMVLQVLEEFARNEAKVREIANHIEMLPLRRFVTSWQIFFEKFGEPIHTEYKDEKKMIKEFFKYNKISPPADLSKFVVRFVLDKSNIILKHMDMETIYNKIRDNFPDSFVIYTPLNVDEVVVRVYFRSTISKSTLNMQKVAELKDSLLNMVVRGVSGIIAANIYGSTRNFVQADGSIKTEKVFSIVTDGTNLAEILENPHIDPYSVQTDSIMEVAEVLGIEAARSKIINELRGQIDRVNYKHYPIYADEMCWTGTVTSIERHGLSKREFNSVLLRMSESSPVAVAEESAINHMHDNLSGISARIICGEPPRVGSLFNSFCLDEEFIKQNTQDVDDVLASLT